MTPAPASDAQRKQNRKISATIRAVVIGELREHLDKMVVDECRQ